MAYMAAVSNCRNYLFLHFVCVMKRVGSWWFTNYNLQISDYCPDTTERVHGIDFLKIAQLCNIPGIMYRARMEISVQDITIASFDTNKTY